jgi:hypothetical protein
MQLYAASSRSELVQLTHTLNSVRSEVVSPRRSIQLDRSSIPVGQSFRAIAKTVAGRVRLRA